MNELPQNKLSMSSQTIDDTVFIDFGTSNTAVRVLRNDGIVNPVACTQSHNCIPSVAMIDDSGITIPDYITRQPTKAFVYNVKRILGKSRDQFEDSEISEELFHSSLELDTNGKPYFGVSYGRPNNRQKKSIYPEEIAREILKKCKEKAEKSLDHPVDKCVMSIPNYFFDTSKEALRQAAKDAGLEVLYFVKEPTAAGINYIHSNDAGDLGIKDGELALVFDFGGGTLDLTAMRRKKDNFVVEAQGGNPNLGGNNIDQSICQWALKRYEDDYGVNPLGSNPDSVRYKRNYSLLLNYCRECKEMLSSQLSFDIPFSNLGVDNDIILTQKEFNIAVMQNDILVSAEEALQPILKEYGREIDHIILCGGSSNIPIIQTFLQDLIPGVPIHKRMDPQMLVVEGIATIVRKDIQFDEVFESSLGFRIGGQFSSHLEPGTRIPSTQNKYFEFSRDGRDRTIEVSRLVNGEWHKEGTLDCSKVRVRGTPRIQINITCEKDTSVTYNVYYNGKCIDTLKLHPWSFC